MGSRRRLIGVIGVYIKATSINLEQFKKLFHQFFCFFDIESHISIKICTGIE